MIKVLGKIFSWHRCIKNIFMNIISHHINKTLFHKAMILSNCKKDKCDWIRYKNHLPLVTQPTKGVNPTWFALHPFTLTARTSMFMHIHGSAILKDISPAPTTYSWNCLRGDNKPIFFNTGIIFFPISLVPLHSISILQADIPTIDPELRSREKPVSHKVRKKREENFFIREYYLVNCAAVVLRLGPG